MTQEVKIPNDRIGAIIGKHGETRKNLEKLLEVTLEVDSHDGLVTITNEEDALAEIRSMEIIKAIGRGFSPERARKLLEDDDMILDLIDISDDADTPQKLSRVRGRIIGRDGKAREQIENMTGTYISVYGKTIGIIGLPDQVNDAHTAVLMLISGSDHNTVFNFLDRKKKEAKMNVISYYY
ncbi:KH domain-containing protein [Methanocorpusculum vombati]|uniref:KH domain-containing protein n=1 Tax=Methanocorpusculum vombati TaxID=3002864 RepID=A0ABT4IJ11_9EURY|nr:KH domain-containing protein [Methanocorpusculum vombati]MCZ9313207.1 KH domain-containing protein [Methanocorpusculum sp.]MCZ0861728.1 KH domain-containing protein [Methanocorpusculum vombati]MCZ9319145.1 KH domain-containing protein [Methanocorpusculum sp.]MDE2521302.1 KH domain-containing protein [Methanocorpusculum sp.]MDE2535039.1 KH domain-containing protein [Methanocorpusculum sp.]